MKKFIPALLFLFTCSFAFTQPVISFQPIVSGLSEPVDVTEVNDGSKRLFIVERTGKIRIWKGTSLQVTPFLDVSSIIEDGYAEQGLLSLAFHPNYVTNGYFYIYYTAPGRPITIARYSRDTDSTANSTSGVVLMSIPKPFLNHNGGDLIFGSDGYLYFGTGDGGSGGDPNNNAQNGTSLLGKMLRINVNNPNPPYYSIPPDNPFAGSTAVRQEIIAVGLRNPWRWSFDKQTGDMWIADVGQNAWEEVNIVPAASKFNKNYGWRCYEGTHVYNASCSAQANNVFPIFEYPHNDNTGGYSITGGFVYRGDEFPALQGYYLFTDFATGFGWLTKSNGSGGWTTTRSNWMTGISSFGETANGTLYATTLGGGLYKVIASGALPVRLISFAGRETGNSFQLTWQVQNEEAGDTYVVEKRIHANEPFSEETRTRAITGRADNNYKVNLPLIAEQAYYRLKIVYSTGEVSYSNIINYNSKTKGKIRAVITGANLNLILPAATTYIELFDAVGKSVARQKVNGSTNNYNFPLSQYAKGVITIRAFVNNEWQVTQVISR
jgi:glucose/arabinose dehydrogenase